MKNKRTLILIVAIILFIILLLTNYKFNIQSKTINNTVVIIIELIILLICVIFAGIIIRIISKKDLSPEKAYLYIVPCFCIIILLTMPMGRGHDESTHWIKAYEISEGKLISKIEDGTSQAKVPKGVEKIFIERDYNTIKYIDNLKLLNVKVDKSNSVLENDQNSATYCFIQYIPQALGIGCAKIFTDIPILMAYTGRIFNIIACCIIMYFSIKNIPFGKNIILALSIIPITIEGISTLSPDGLTISIAFFFISYVLKMTYDDTCKIRYEGDYCLAIIWGSVGLMQICIHANCIFDNDNS